MQGVSLQFILIENEILIIITIIEYSSSSLNNMEIGWFIWSNGSNFTVTFSHNNIEGRGTCEWSNGRRYEGDWKDNKMDRSILMCKLIFNYSNYS